MGEFRPGLESRGGRPCADAFLDGRRISASLLFSSFGLLLCAVAVCRLRYNLLHLGGSRFPTGLFIRAGACEATENSCSTPVDSASPSLQLSRRVVFTWMPTSVARH